MPLPGLVDLADRATEGRITRSRGADDHRCAGADAVLLAAM